MTSTCSVAGCSNSSRHKKNNPHLQFHQFPVTRNKALLKKWNSFCKREERLKLKNSRICSEHFEESDYHWDLQHELLGLPPRKILKIDAVPSIFNRKKAKDEGREVKEVSDREKRNEMKERKRIVKECLAQHEVKEVESEITSGYGSPNPLSPDVEVKEENEDLRCVVCLNLSIPEDTQCKWWAEFKHENLSCLDKHLSSIFLLRKVFNVEETECAALLEKSFGLNPGSWFVLCEGCSDFVREAVDLHQKILPLERRLDKVKKQMKRRMEDSLRTDKDLGRNKPDTGVLNVHNLIRNCLRTQNIIEKTGQPLLEGNFDGDTEADNYLMYNSDHDTPEMSESAEQSQNSFPQENLDHPHPLTKSDSLTTPHEKSDPLHSKIIIRIRKHFKRTSQTRARRAKRQILKPRPNPPKVEDKAAQNSDDPILFKKKRIQNSKPRPFKCDICTSKYSTEILLQRHKKDHELYSTTTCDICHIPCKTEDQLALHKRIHQICPICHENIKIGSIELSKHMRHHKMNDNTEILEDGNKFKCKLCPEGEIFFNKKHLFVHMKDNHAGELGLELFPCHICGRNSYCKFELLKHIRTVHEKKYRFSCNICGASFERSYIHQSHMERHANGGKDTSICDCCGLSFANMVNLKKHVKQFHSGNGTVDKRKLAPWKNKCKHCSAQVVDNKELRRHYKMSHPELYTFKCDQCDNVYTKRSHLDTHKSVKHSEKKSVCPYCFVEVSCEEYLKIHWRLRCRKKPEKNSGREITAGEVANGN